MKKHFKQQIDAMVRAYRSYDGEGADQLLDNCLETIRQGKSIIATAVGKNVPVCEKFIGTLNSLGIDGHFMHTNSAIHGDLGLVHDGDLVILLSKSGETIEIIHLCKFLLKRNITTWLLTCSKDCSASRLVENSLVFEIGHEGDPWNLVPNNSTLVFLMFLQSLSMTLLDKLQIPLEIFKRNHPGGNIGRILAKK
jgi:arabinose-5-phosphate isomerase